MGTACMCVSLVYNDLNCQFCTGKLQLHKNLTHQGESGPGLDPGLLMPFQLQQDFGPGHGTRRMYLVSAPSPESAHWGDRVTRTH